MSQVLQEFGAAWQFMGPGFLAAWLLAVTLGLLGVLVVARDQIFVGAAMTQASALGLAIALVYGHQWVGHGHEGWLILLLPMMLGIGTALLTGFGAGAGLSREALTGMVFLLGASGTVLVLMPSPIGMKEVQERLSSAMFSATPGEILALALLAVITQVGFWGWRRQWLLLAIDAPMAAALGMRPARWEWLWSIWLGTVLGVAIRGVGTLYAFGCLVLPALLAGQLCKELWQVALWAPLLALLAATTGSIAANHWDLPAGQVIVAFLAGALVLVWLPRRVRRMA